MYSPQQNGQPAGGENMVQKISKKVCAWKLEMDEIHREGWVSWTFIKSFFFIQEVTGSLGSLIKPASFLSGRRSKEPADEVSVYAFKYVSQRIMSLRISSSKLTDTCMYHISDQTSGLGNSNLWNGHACKQHCCASNDFEHKHTSVHICDCLYVLGSDSVPNEIPWSTTWYHWQSFTRLQNSHYHYWFGLILLLLLLLLLL